MATTTHHRWVIRRAAGQALGTLLSASGLSSVHADTLYGVNFSSTTTNLYSISDTTGVATSLGVLAGVTQATGAEWDIATQRLIIATGNNTDLGNLYSVDPATRAVTPLSPVRIGSSASGTLQEGGFAIDPTTRKRYGVIPALNYTYLIGSDGTYAPIDSLFDAVQPVDPSGLTVACDGTSYALMYDQKEVEPARVYKVDLETGKATPLTQDTGVFPLTGTFGSITHRPDGGSLWMTEGSRLFTVNRNTGAATLVGAHGLPAGTRLSGLAWSGTECPPCANPTTIVRRTGTIDEFVGPEPTTPSAAMNTFLQRLNGNNRAYHNSQNRRFDECGVDWEFGHTFDTLPAGNYEGKLTFRLRGNADPLLFNDSLGFGFNIIGGLASQLWASAIKDIPLTPGGASLGSWTANNPTTFVMDLENLPAHSGLATDLLPIINQTGQLDFYLQDDTCIDFIELELKSCGCLPRNRVYSRGDMDNFVQTSSDSTINRARGAFAQWLATPGGNNAANHSGIPQPFDQAAPVNWNFGVTFTSLPTQIQRATLEIRLRAGIGADNDSMGMQFIAPINAANPLIEWGLGMQALTGLSWSTGQTTTVVLDLATLPATSGGTILDTMNQRGYLDVLVFDDTAVDYIKLDMDACGQPRFYDVAYATNGVTSVANANGFRVFNFGSSGNDGVTFSFDAASTARFSLPVPIDPCQTFNPPPQCFGAGDEFDIRWSAGGLVAPAAEPGEDPVTAPRVATVGAAIGSVRINTATGFPLRAFGDFGPVGSSTSTVQILDGGVIRGSLGGVGAGAPDAVTFQGYPGDVVLDTIDLGGRPQYCIAVRFPTRRGITLPGAAGVVGNEIRFISELPAEADPYPVVFTDLTLTSDMDSVGPGGVQFEFADVQIVPLPAAPACCPGDADSSGGVSFADITSVLANLGAASSPGVQGPGDADCSGGVSFADITTVLANLGAACE